MPPRVSHLENEPGVDRVKRNVILHLAAVIPGDGASTPFTSSILNKPLMIRISRKIKGGNHHK